MSPDFMSLFKELNPADLRPLDVSFQSALTRLPDASSNVWRRWEGVHVTDGATVCVTVINLFWFVFPISVSLSRSQWMQIIPDYSRFQRGKKLRWSELPVRGWYQALSSHTKKCFWHETKMFWFILAALRDYFPTEILKSGPELRCGWGEGQEPSGAALWESEAGALNSRLYRD